MSDVMAAKDNYTGSLDNLPDRARIAKGLVGYVAFATFLGFDFALLGIV
jgi:hypothetical protein